MNSEHQRPKRHVQKKWDPNFIVMSGHPAAKTEKRLSSEDGADGDEDAASSQKRIRKKRHSVTDSSLAENKVALNGDYSDGKKTKCCDKVVCVKSGVKPVCCVGLSSKCPKSSGSWTSRWYHLSIGEHYCNDCFDMFYRINKEGYEQFNTWKILWCLNGLADANVKMFVVDSCLPFWLKCNDCSKWRMVPKDTEVTTSVVLTFTCDSELLEDTDITCDEPEDEIVEICKQEEWLDNVLYSALLISSPMEPFVVNYYADGVGMSASCANPSKNRPKKKKEDLSVSGISDHDVKEMTYPEVPNVPFYFQPFIQPDRPSHALAHQPDNMSQDEMDHFPKFSKEQLTYLAIRNHIIALWTLNPKVVLTTSACLEKFICRGLMRIVCHELMPTVLRYLTRRSIVNTGIVEGSLEDVCPSSRFKASVIVIGAGAAGLAATKQLKNMGCEVTLLEARDRVGGRVLDDHNMGVCIAKGAQIVPGCINNPISLLSHQANIQLIEMSELCTLIDEKGQVIDDTLNHCMDFHFNNLLDNLDTWRKRKEREDVNLLQKLKEIHAEFLLDSKIPFTDHEESIINFHTACMEQVCGANLNQLSALHWDQNEDYPQFAGSTFRACDGLSKVMAILARQLNIKFRHEVVKVDYSGPKVIVTLSTGLELTCDHLVVAVPLSVLKMEAIQFVPDLPERKLDAIKSIGGGLLEKVCLKFPRRFWEGKVKNGESFGHIPSSFEKRGHFVVFYDTTHPKQHTNDGREGVLTTFLTGSSANLVSNTTDREIVESCLSTLRKLFPEVDVPEPLCYLVTRWQSDKFSGLSYSYLPVGCNGDVYDDMAEPVDGKLFFAGEATNRMFPQSVCGAYLSGLREANRILDIQDPL